MKEFFRILGYRNLKHGIEFQNSVPRGDETMSETFEYTSLIDFYR